MSKNTNAVRVESWLANRIAVSLGKTGHSVTVQVERLEPDVLAHVFNYGLKQILNDAAAGGKTEDEKLGLFNKRLETLYSGSLRAARESDPVAKEAKRIATDYVTRKTQLKAGSDEFKAAVGRAAASDAIRHLAEAAVAKAKELDLDIEL